MSYFGHDDCNVKFVDKDMVLELEALRAKHGVCGRERSPSRLDAFVKSLEEERDRYRQEAEHCRRVRGAGSPARSPVRSRSPAGKVIRILVDCKIIYKYSFLRLCQFCSH